MERRGLGTQGSMLLAAAQGLYRYASPSSQVRESAEDPSEHSARAECQGVSHSPLSVSICCFTDVSDRDQDFPCTSKGHRYFVECMRPDTDDASSINDVSMADDESIGPISPDGRNFNRGAYTQLRARRRRRRSRERL